MNTKVLLVALPLLLTNILPAVRAQGGGLFDFGPEIELVPFDANKDGFSIGIPPGFEHSVNRRSKDEVSHRFESDDYHYAVVMTAYPGDELDDYSAELKKLEDLARGMNRIFGGETVSVSTTTEGGLVSQETYIIDKTNDRKTHMRLYSWNGRIYTVLVHGKTSLVTTDESNAVLDSFQFDKSFFDASQLREIGIAAASIRVKMPPITKIVKAGKEDPLLADASILLANDPAFGLQIAMTMGEGIDSNQAIERLLSNMVGGDPKLFAAGKVATTETSVNGLKGSETTYEVSDAKIVSRSFVNQAKKKQVALVSLFAPNNQRMRSMSKQFLDSLRIVE